MVLTLRNEQGKAAIGLNRWEYYYILLKYIYISNVETYVHAAVK